MPLSSKSLAIAGGDPAVSPGTHRTWPEITDSDRAAVAAVYDRGQLWGPHGPETLALQEEFAAYCGARHCRFVNSGTSALHCALVGSGVQPGDEVIFPAFTFVATQQAILHAGAIPVCCDIDAATMCLDPVKAEALITERTTAIMPVHVHGLPADMAAFDAIAQRHGVAIVEDAAQAAGATYFGRRAGTLGAAAGFSLNATKPWNAGGEGGVCVTDDDQTILAAERLAIFGEDTPKPGPGELRAYWSHGIGWNYRSFEVPAAFARSQLRRLDSYLARARENAAILTTALAEIPGFTPQSIPDAVSSSHYGYRIRFDPDHFRWDGDPVELRDRIIFALRAEGVASASIWQWLPIPAQPVSRRSTFSAWTPKAPADPLRPWYADDHPVTSRLLAQSFCLGMDPWPLQVQDASLVHQYVTALRKVIEHIDAVKTIHYRPLRRIPPVPPGELSPARRGASSHPASPARPS